MSSTVPDAAKLVGLLADDTRRRTFAALALGASTIDEVVEASGLAAKDVHDAVARLTTGGLVVLGDSGSLVLLASVFGHAARAAATTTERPSSPRERVLQTFVVDGRLTSLPKARAKRLVVLEEIAQDFEPGLKYSEGEVSVIAERWHDDYAALRRWLVDERFLDRDNGTYWRSGGAVLNSE
ncbi:MAG: DUF2087 domain-containing protein [Actinomycetia bacterium]|nr:DUF2087 domain-containing protein [Actinomycetes bacterium]